MLKNDERQLSDPEILLNEQITYWCYASMSEINKTDDDHPF